MKLAGLVMLLVGRIARADCLPSAVTSGDPTLVAAVASRLASAGVATRVATGCPVVRVTIEQHGADVVVRADQRERVVHDLATAAAVIESWTLQEVMVGDLPPEVVTSREPRGIIQLAARSAVVDDGGAWLGVGAAGCLRLGRACVGASATFAESTTSISDATRGAQTSKLVDALAIIDVPWRDDAWSLIPGLGVGWGWQSIAQQHMAGTLPVSVETSLHALRGELHLALARMLGPIELVAEVRGELSIVHSGSNQGIPRGGGGLALGVRWELP